MEDKIQQVTDKHSATISHNKKNSERVVSSDKGEEEVNSVNNQIHPKGPDIEQREKSTPVDENKSAKLTDKHDKAEESREEEEDEDMKETSRMYITKGISHQDT